MSHHPSCLPTDKDLVWHCCQCGENEPAEEEVLARLARQRAALEWIGMMVSGELCRCPPQNVRGDPCFKHLVSEKIVAALAQDARPTEPTG